jgi:hypothetical protein
MPPEAVNGGDTRIAGRSPVCYPRINRQDVRRRSSKRSSRPRLPANSDQMSDTGAIPGREHASQIVKQHASLYNYKVLFQNQSTQNQSTRT